MTDAPQYFRWDADKSAMIPWRKALADRTYVDQAEYRLGVIEERSVNSHKAYFAQVTEVWRNLPAKLAEHYPSPDHLRKDALIETGYFDQTVYGCASHAEALRWCPRVAADNDYARVIVNGSQIIKRVAKSQSYRAMGAKDFQASKSAVLDYLSDLIGVKLEALRENAGRAA